ncbi:MULTISPECIES: AlpA family phage regulatory protein [Acinetobacter]|nr:AlpA family phage regulatory protein [Acinetobacter bereziniae]MBJ8458529.1 AlpA family phage regulatory protein [Acinetobacter bereziniae]MCU4316399.1 AlpA family transcriptional regulator [Acinetobacter bereziniae]UJA02730.1 AlpA family phage regulatory protein [Acinetobacter johnsonii]
MNTSTDYQYRIFNIKAVIEVTALSRSTIYELIKPTSPYYDASFPKPIHLT